MSDLVRTPFVLAIIGSSLTTGRLSADWVPTLQHDLPLQPEAKGPIRIYNRGHGSMASDWLLTQAQAIADLNPTHVLTEGFAINDCVDFGTGPYQTRAQHIANIQASVAIWRTHPDVDITIQTMSSVSAAVAVGRPALADYYADELALGATLGLRAIDNYAGWPKPLDPAFTNAGDGLHPVWTGAVDTYLYPNVLAWARARMAEFWPA